MEAAKTNGDVASATAAPSVAGTPVRARKCWSHYIQTCVSSVVIVLFLASFLGVVCVAIFVENVRAPIAAMLTLMVISGFGLVALGLLGDFHISDEPGMPERIGGRVNGSLQAYATPYAHENFTGNADARYSLGSAQEAEVSRSMHGSYQGISDSSQAYATPYAHENFTGNVPETEVSQSMHSSQQDIAANSVNAGGSGLISDAEVRDFFNV